MNCAYPSLPDFCKKSSEALWVKGASTVDISPDAMRDALRDVSFPDWQADGLIEDLCPSPLMGAESLSGGFLRSDFPLLEGLR